MRTIALVLGIVVAGACLGAMAVPQVSVDLSSYNFPDTIDGMAVVHTFLLTNMGDGELVITDVKVSCGCTTTALASDRLQPGETVGLTATVNTEGFLHSISKTIFVTSNDPERQAPNELQLTISGNVLERRPYQYSVPHLLEMAYILLDVRDAAAYAMGHLAGAMNLPADEIAARASSLPPEILTVFYDQNGDSTTLEAATQALHAGGVGLVYGLQGGLDSWQGNYGTTRMVTGGDVSWGTFLDAPGDPAYSVSSSVRVYDVGRLLTDYILIDVRPASAFAAGHLVGALNLPEAGLAGFVEALPREIPVILYSEDGVDSDRVAQDLWAQGSYPRSLLGGLAEWRTQHGDLLLMASAN
jgi:rhodanese-related sulfurtransferase